MADLDYLINFNSNTGGVDKAKFAVNKLAGAMAALGIGFGASELAQIADEYANLSSRISIAVGETGNYQAAMDGVKEVALATNSNLTATAQLFTKINDAGKQMGMTQQDALDLTETINKAMQLGGGAAASNEAAIVQLTQALQSGVLRGDEFNSIMEQAPGLSKALAASLGVTTGELRGMAQEGKLSAQTVIGALQEQSGAIDAEYAKLPLTVDKALQNIKTQWMVLIGEFNKDSGATSKVAEWLGVLEQNMGMLETVLDDVGEGVQWIGDKINGIDTGTIVAMKQALQSAYDVLKSMATAAGDVFESMGSGLDLTLGMLMGFESGLTDAESKTAGFTKAIQFLNVALGFINDGFAGIGIAAKLFVGAMYDVAGAWSQLQSHFMAGDAKDAAIANMNDMRAKAQEMYGEASKAALEFESKGMAAYNRLHQTESELNAESLADTQKTFSDKAQAYADYVSTEADYAAQRIALEQKIAEARSSGNTEHLAEYINQLDAVTAKEQEQAATVEQLQSDKTAAAQAYAQQAVDANNGVLDSNTLLELATQNYMAAVDEAGKVTVTAFDGAKKSSEGLAISLGDTALNAAKGLGIDVNEALNKVSSGFERNSEAVRRVADGYDELKNGGVDAGNLLHASLLKLLEGAKSQAEIDNVRQMYVKFGQDGKLAAGQVDAGIDAVNGKLDKTPAMLDETTKALKALGIISQEEAEKQARQAIADFETVKNSGKASAEQLSQALDGVGNKIDATGNTGFKTWLEGQRAALGYAGAIDGTASSLNNQTAALSSNAAATEQNTAASSDNASAKEAQAAASEQAAQKEAQHGQTQSSVLAIMQRSVNAVKEKISALQGEAATVETTNSAYQKLVASIGAMNKRYLDMAGFNADMQRLNDIVDAQQQHFDSLHDSVQASTSALSGAVVTSNDLEQAQQALRKATSDSSYATTELGKQTLAGLQDAIDSTRQKMQDLATDAGKMVDDLEVSLAKMQGNDDKARELEQAKKLAAIQDKINAAKKAGNNEAANELQKALHLQKQINEEEDKKAAAKKAEEAEREQEKADKEREKIEKTKAQKAEAQKPQVAKSEPSSATKTVNVNIKMGGQTINANVPESQEASFIALLKQLEQSKSASGQ